jgi:hypothetical protein
MDGEQPPGVGTLIGCFRLVAVTVSLVGAALLLRAGSEQFEWVRPIHVASPYETALGSRALLLAAPAAALCCVMAAVEARRFWPGVAGVLLAPCLATAVFSMSVDDATGYWGVAGAAYQDGFSHAMLGALAVLTGGVVWVAGAAIAGWTASPRPPR